MSAVEVAIIGTAGRGEDGHRMTESLFDLMVTRARMLIRQELHSSSVINLISGGAAWADHVAVALFFNEEEANLTLHIPCGWDHAKMQFVDKGTDDWRTNPGRTMNKYHRQFSTKTRHNSLRDIHLALQVGACAKTYSGFHRRNTEVAKADVLIAFGWGTGGYPVTSGTADTWKKCKASKKIHVNLDDLIMECSGEKVDKSVVYRTTYKT